MTTGPQCPRCGTVAAPGARFCGTCGGPLAAPAEVAEDQLLVRLRQATLGEYDVLRELGRGGMAAVYLAWDRDLARHVAVKVLLPELAHHPGMSQRFLQEARTAANLDDHPSVVRVYRAKEAEGLRYFVMKYVDGCSLEQLLRATGPLRPDLATHVIDQVALALQYAHDHGVVHRDVKPGNILLDRAGGVTVTDFGIAKVAEAESLTRTGLAIGTPHYMSPEQWRVEPLTASSDQYALGVVAHQLVSGAVPFDGTQYEIQEGHLRAEAPPLSEVRPGVPPALDAVVSVMLSKRPEERFPDLYSVSRALADVPRDPTPVMRAHLAKRVAAAAPDGGRALTPAGASPATPAAVGPAFGGPVFGSPAVVGAPAAVATPAVGPASPVPAWGPPSPAPITPLSVVPPAPAPPVPAPPAVQPAAATPGVAMPAVVSAAAMAPTVNAVSVDRPASTPAPAHAPAPLAAAAAAPAPETEGPAVVTAVVTADDAPPSPVRRRRSPVPVLAGVGLAAVAVAVVALRGRGSAGARPAVGTPAPETAAAATSPGPTPGVGQAPGGQTSAAPAPPAGAITPDPAAVATDDPALTPAEEADPPPPATPVVGPRVATALLIFGAPTGGRATLAVGDSVRLRARVNDARGARMAEAVVQWASSDPARVAFRNGWAVALAPGGPVDVTAASGPLRRAVRVQVTPRAAAPAGTYGSAPPAAGAAPSEAEVQQAVQGFVAALRARDPDLLARLGERAADGSPAREFVDWVRSAKKYGVGAPAAGAVATAGGAPRVAVRVPLRYARGGLLNSVGTRDATFYLTLTRDGGGWRTGQAVLASRFRP